MPSSVVKSLAKETNKSISEVEKLWDKAKKIVSDEYKDVKKDSDKYYQLVTGTLKNMLNIKEEKENNNIMAKRIKEVSNNYYNTIEAIEMYLGYEEAIRAWEKGISVDDAKVFLEAMAREYDINIKPIRDRSDVFDAVEEFENYLSYENMFNEFFYNVSDKVAEYLFKRGIMRDYDLNESKEKETIIPLTKSIMIEGEIIEAGKVIKIIEADKGTAKCPTCGGKYLKATGYCVKCKKKVKEEADTSLEESYNGYSNYETWSVDLWVSNDENIYGLWMDNTPPRGWTAKEVEQFMKEVWPNGTPDMKNSGDYRKVNWKELADMWNE